MHLRTFYPTEYISSLRHWFLFSNAGIYGPISPDNFRLKSSDRLVLVPLFALYHYILQSKILTFVH